LKVELGLKGKVAVVTGASKGIGKAIARSLAAEGSEVVLCARNKKDLAEAAEEIAREGIDPLAVSADLIRPGGAKQVVQETKARFGRVDVLVNNLGGLLHFASFMELTDDDWRAELELDLMSAVRMCREVVPLMQRQGGGRIINIASMSGIEMEAKFPDYRIGKAALIALSKYLSVELAPSHILVNTVCPGAVWTPSWEFEADVLSKKNKIPKEKMLEQLRKETEKSIPLGIGQPEEVARVVTFLASPQVTWMTGSTIRIDGGAAKLIL
jgi:3-oxoacyl-[acyl-carrier protein] reductase